MMVEFIASKESNPDGQLEKLNIPSGVNLLPLSEGHRILKADKNNLTLIGNQLNDIFL